MIQFLHFIFFKIFHRLVDYVERKYFISKLGYCDKSAYVCKPIICTCPQKVYLYKNTNLYGGATILINRVGNYGKFIMKDNSGAAQNLTVVTGNHQRKLGYFLKDFSGSHILDVDKDVIVEEDVWIGVNVTLAAGVIVGRGSTIAAGSVCLKNVPPYSIVIGNPAKVVGFNFTPNEIVEHEIKLYKEENRLSFDMLEKNYKKYYLNRINEVKNILK